MRWTVAAIIMLTFLVACMPKPVLITSFDECVAAGNPVMESYPRQCRADGQTFVEDVELPELPEPPSPIEEPPSTGQITFTICEDPRPEICTLEYNPVCGLVDNGVRCVTEPCASFDAKTYGNGCGACGDAAVFSFVPGACEDVTFVICNEIPLTGFDPVEYANQIGGACVDVCPGNYDEFVTQIGVRQCIQHYGVEEIESWSICERSAENCNCVRAYETTRSEQIDPSEYRCVPDDYSGRLVFRAGVDRLDENGQQSTVIA